MNIVFILQRGELEIKALLLAWSLRRSQGKRQRLYAATPSYGDWADCEPEVLAALRELGVKLLPFEPAFAPHYPIGNKLSVLQALPADAPAMFLDSDMLSLSPWRSEELLGDNAVVAKPADAATWGGHREWSRVYASLGSELSPRWVRLTVTGQLSFPYFNAGMVATRQPRALGEGWLNFAKHLSDPGLDLGERYPWLDQIALPVAMQALDGGWAAVGEHWNFPAHLRPLPDELPALCHYHHPGVIEREPALLGLFRRACRELPALKNCVRQYPQWQPLLGSPAPRRRTALQRRDFLITGVPRSGTSYLCSLLDQQRNWLVINEPAPIFAHLIERPDASGVALFHRETRERIHRGLPVQNKLRNGAVVSDTAQYDERHWYHPQLQRGDFWLGSKNTLAYMAALPRLCELGWPVVALVRHPLDTLASWRDSFEHLREAQVEHLPVANPEFPAWQAWQRRSLLEITQQQDATLRRVLLWRLLVRSLLDHRQTLLMWRYEDMVRDPTAHLRRLARLLGHRLPLARVSASQPRARTTLYLSTERDLLGDLCAPELRELDYAL